MNDEPVRRVKLEGSASALDKLTESLSELVNDGLKITRSQRPTSPLDRQSQGQHPIVEVVVLISLNIVSAAIYDQIKALIQRSAASGDIEKTEDVVEPKPAAGKSGEQVGRGHDEA